MIFTLQDLVGTNVGGRVTSRPRNRHADNGARRLQQRRGGSGAAGDRHLLCGRGRLRRQHTGDVHGRFGQVVGNERRQPSAAGRGNDKFAQSDCRGRVGAFESRMVQAACVVLHREFTDRAVASLMVEIGTRRNGEEKSRSERVL